MSVAPVIHIGGWPGSGKFTVGTIVAKTLGGRLIDNHIMLDAARALYARGAAGSSQLREDIRAVMLSHARALPDDVALVLTDALADEPAALPLFEPTRQLAKDRAAPLHCFVLDLSEDENARRLTDLARSGRAKLRDGDILRDLRAKHRLFYPAGAIRLDVTSQTAQQTAEQICALVPN